MRQGRIYENASGRYQLENDSYYWTCGDYIEIYYDHEWLKGRVEANNKGEYYFTDDACEILLYNGLEVRIDD